MCGDGNATDRAASLENTRRDGPVSTDVEVSELDMTIVTMVKQSALQLP
jgi:hypothetical protein